MKSIKTFDYWFVWLPVVFFMLLAGCRKEPTQLHQEEPEIPEYSKAIAVLYPTEGNTARGWVSFTVTDNGVLIEAEVTGLTPGEHGFHIHEFGDCSALDATSAGGHFNPFGEKHGAPDSLHRHVGDLGNLIADENGIAKYQRLDTLITLSGPNSIIGRAVIVHENPDDFVSQPTGNAGGRVACGVIGIAKQ